MRHNKHRRGLPSKHNGTLVDWIWESQDFSLQLSAHALGKQSSIGCRHLSSRPLSRVPWQLNNRNRCLYGLEGKHSFRKQGKRKRLILCLQKREFRFPGLPSLWKSQLKRRSRPIDRSILPLVVRSESGFPFLSNVEVSFSNRQCLFLHDWHVYQLWFMTSCGTPIRCSGIDLFVGESCIHPRISQICTGSSSG